MSLNGKFQKYVKSDSNNNNYTVSVNREGRVYNLLCMRDHVSLHIFCYNEWTLFLEPPLIHFSRSLSLFIVRSEMRDSSNKDHREYHAGNIPTPIHVCCHRSSTL